jgi:hypothetical protein
MNNLKVRSTAPRRSEGNDGYLEFGRRQIVVYCSRDGGYNLNESLRQARHIRRVLGHVIDHVLYINTPFQEQRVKHKLRQLDLGDEKDNGFTMMSIDAGTLARERDRITGILARKKCPVVMINSWEFVAANSRQKESLVFFLHRLLEDYNASVLIYSYADADTARAGFFSPHGLGKLAYMCDKIYAIGTSDKAAAEPAMKQAGETKETTQETTIERKIEMKKDETPKQLQDLIDRPETTLPNKFLGTGGYEEIEAKWIPTPVSETNKVECQHAITGQEELMCEVRTLLSDSKNNKLAIQVPIREQLRAQNRKPKPEEVPI